MKELDAEKKATLIRIDFYNNGLRFSERHSEKVIIFMKEGPIIIFCTQCLWNCSNVNHLRDYNIFFFLNIRLVSFGG